MPIAKNIEKEMLKQRETERLLKEIAETMKLEYNKKIELKEEERKLLEEIAEIVTLEYAEKVAKLLDFRKYLYSFEGYLGLLQKLKALLKADMPPEIALESAQTSLGADEIIGLWRNL